MKYNKITLNIPHSSGVIPEPEQFTNTELLNSDVFTMTDWFTDKLFCADGVDSVVAPFSRFYCDIERLLPDPEQEAKGQGVIYTHSINGERFRRELTNIESDKIFDMYHQLRGELSSLIGAGDLLIDCHSFSDEYVGRDDIDICIGYNEDASKPNVETLNIIKECFSEWRVAINEPFSNSITPRPKFDYKSVMIEVNKRLYMDIVDGEPVYREGNDVREAILEMYNKLIKLR